LTTDNYKDAVLKAVNLGEDTDTTAAVTGGLAGLLYGLDNIPSNWINQIAKHDDIE
jgi:ADP-ribosylglycohydrolase